MLHVTAGAVSRPSGSIKRLAAGNSGNCSRTPLANWADVMTQRFSQPWAGMSNRSAVVWSKLRPLPSRLRNCFGRSRRLRGQKRSPFPPAKIIQTRGCEEWDDVMGKG